jgi:hypothetical protein
MLGILARWVRRKRRAILPFLAVALRLLLVVGGLGMLTAAAWALALPAGLAAGGVSLLLLEWIVKRQ